MDIRSDIPHRICIDASALGDALRSQPLLKGLLTVGSAFSSESGECLLPGRSFADAMLFVYCVRGKARCEVAGRLQSIDKGDLLVIPPGVTYACRSHSRQPWAVYWVQAIGAHLPQYLRELRMEAGRPVLRVGEDPQLIRLFNEVLRSLLRGTQYVHLLQASHAFAYLLSLLIQKRRQDAPPASDTIQKVAEAIIFMSEHLDQPLRVSTLASAAGLSPDYFTDLFKTQAGCSPRDYLRLLRMHRACQLLRGSPWTVKEIAGLTGYQDPFHFSRQFKEFYGVSPTEFRGPAVG